MFKEMIEQGDKFLNEQKSNFYKHINNMGTFLIKHKGDQRYFVSPGKGLTNDIKKAFRFSLKHANEIMRGNISADALEIIDSGDSEAIKVKIKKLVPEAVIPKYAKDGDAGLDLVATSAASCFLYIEYGTGLAVEIPRGHVGLLFPRSSITNKTLMVKNSVGVIDSGYRGEIKVRAQRVNESSLKDIYEVGDKVAQLIIMPYPSIEFEEVEELSSSERGEGGYGSTGK